MVGFDRIKGSCFGNKYVKCVCFALMHTAEMSHLCFSMYLAAPPLSCDKVLFCKYYQRQQD